MDQAGRGSRAEQRSRSEARAAGEDTADQRESTAGEAPRTVRRRWIGLGLGLVLALSAFLLLPDSLSPEGRGTAAVAVLMAVWWMTEAIPLPATALVPLVLFPVLGIAEVGDAASPYANDVIFLFMGGFMLALAMQRWNLHRRLALATVLAVGTSPRRLVAGFMVATGFISMWVSNTATAVMMLPIGLSVLGLVRQLGKGEGDTNFGTSLLLGIAYAASIGSLGTIIGTPPNTLMVGYLRDSHDIHVGFGQWMLVGVPMAVIFLLLTWLVLTRFVFPPRITEIPGGRELIRRELTALGPVSRAEWMVLAVFVLAALSWIFLPLLTGASGLDAVIAMAVAVLLFILPVSPREGVAVLDWQTAKEIPWGVLLLFGGGLSLSSQFSASGLSEWIGQQVAGVGAVPVLLLVVGVAILVLALTELTSNTATAATFLPIMGGVALGLGLDVMTLAIPVALAATCAFMLPVATPPNAIAFGSGHIRIGQMVRAGLWLNLITVVLIALVMYTLASWVFGLAV